MIIAAGLVPVGVKFDVLCHIVDRKTENYKKVFFCKVPSESKEKEQFKNGACLFAFSICVRGEMRRGWGLGWYIGGVCVLKSY